MALRGQRDRRDWREQRAGGRLMRPMTEHATEDRITAERIRELVYHSYWVVDINCAKTALRVLADLRAFALQPQVLEAAAGMHGAGLHRAQCGLVEGTLMFLGVFLAARVRSDAPATKGSDPAAAEAGDFAVADRSVIAATKESDATVTRACNAFAAAFEAEFGSLRCFDLRPGGFRADDPPHACESLSLRAIKFAHEFIRGRSWEK